MMGYHPDVILAGRRINDGMGAYVAGQLIKAMIARRIQVDGARVLVLGLSFKENCPDLRNTKVVDLIRGLERYGMEVEYVRPETTREEYEKLHGGPLYGVRPDQCCHDRKVIPLRRALAGYSAWISSIRKDQTADRGQAKVVQWDAKFKLVKVNPLLNWDKSAVWKVVLNEKVPYNSLHDQGYPSIGCQPCTTAVADGEDERSGRWRGKVKKECGLHVVEHSDGSGI